MGNFVCGQADAPRYDMAMELQLANEYMKPSRRLPAAKVVLLSRPSRGKRSAAGTPASTDNGRIEEGLASDFEVPKELYSENERGTVLVLVVIHLARVEQAKCEAVRRLLSG